MLVIDGAYLYLRSLPRSQRIDRIKPRGLPTRAAPLPEDLRVLFNRLGAPDTIRKSPR